MVWNVIITVLLVAAVVFAVYKCVSRKGRSCGCTSCDGNCDRCAKREGEKLH